MSIAGLEHRSVYLAPGDISRLLHAWEGLRPLLQIAQAGLEQGLFSSRSRRRPLGSLARLAQRYLQRRVSLLLPSSLQAQLKWHLYGRSRRFAAVRAYLYVPERINSWLFPEPVDCVRRLVHALPAAEDVAAHRESCEQPACRQALERLEALAAQVQRLTAQHLDLSQHGRWISISCNPGFNRVNSAGYLVAVLQLSVNFPVSLPLPSLVLEYFAQLVCEYTTFYHLLYRYVSVCESGCGAAPVLLSPYSQELCDRMAAADAAMAAPAVPATPEPVQLTLVEPVSTPETTVSLASQAYLIRRQLAAQALQRLSEEVRQQRLAAGS